MVLLWVLSFVFGCICNVGVVVFFFDCWFFSIVLLGVLFVLMCVGYDIMFYNIIVDKDVCCYVFDMFLWW